MNEEQLKYPLDSKSVEILKGFLDDNLPDKIFNVNWNKYFYYSTFFESIDRWLINDSASISTNGLSLLTVATTNAYQEAKLTIGANSLLDFSKKSRYRTAVRINVVANATLDIYFDYDYATDNYYGFRIDDGVIKGFTSYETTELVINLSTVGNDVWVELEAKYVPNEGVMFLVNGVERGKIVKNLPNIKRSPNAIIDYSLLTKENVAKLAEVSYFEVIQEK